ncbi:hypothetical protein [Saccharopolyspora antimicrobica]|uniref:hypothetical protein n=1 Tax=Saccharopolyspora antimicrobica TaxID=455193 RepID=UPI001160499A|nr:hypothetical protein [Saccharopolyspora antimicrobica]
MPRGDEKQPRHHVPAGAERQLRDVVTAVGAQPPDPGPVAELAAAPLFHTLHRAIDAAWETR